MSNKHRNRQSSPDSAAENSVATIDESGTESGEQFRAGFYRVVIDDPKNQFPPNAAVPLTTLPDRHGRDKKWAWSLTKKVEINRLQCPNDECAFRVGQREADALATTSAYEWEHEQPYRPGWTKRFVEEHKWYERQVRSYHCPHCGHRGIRKQLGEGKVYPPREVSQIVWLTESEVAEFYAVTDPDRKGRIEYEKRRKPDGTLVEVAAGFVGGPLTRVIDRRARNGLPVREVVKWGTLVSLEFIGDDERINPMKTTAKIGHGDNKRKIAQLKSVWQEQAELNRRIEAGEMTSDERAAAESRIAELSEKEQIISREL